MGQLYSETFTEQAGVEFIYCSGVANVFIEADNVHISFYRENMAADGIKERLIVLRMVVPAALLSTFRETVDFEIKAASLRAGANVGLTAT